MLSSPTVSTRETLDVAGDDLKLDERIFVAPLRLGLPVNGFLEGSVDDDRDGEAVRLARETESVCARDGRFLSGPPGVKESTDPCRVGLES